MDQWIGCYDFHIVGLDHPMNKNDAITFGIFSYPIIWISLKKVWVTTL